MVVDKNYRHTPDQWVVKLTHLEKDVPYWIFWDKNRDRMGIIRQSESKAALQGKKIVGEFTITDERLRFCPSIILRKWPLKPFENQKVEEMDFASVYIYADPDDDLLYFADKDEKDG